jgi:SAM-dependent methyltransferase
MDWRSFWDGDHAIYVSETHRHVHYQAIADGILDHVATLAAPAQSVVLDYACGEALEAHRVAAAVGKLVLCDGAPSVVAKLNERHVGVAVVPEDLDRVLGDGEADLIVVSSLIQYLTLADFEALVDLLSMKLKAGGRLVVADVIPPDAGLVADVTSLLRNGIRHGYFYAGLVGLVATAVSPYRKLRQSLGLTTYSQADMITLLTAHGLSAHRHEPNLGLTPHRMTFVATR